MSQPNVPYPELARQRIKSTLLIDKLQDHVLDPDQTPMTKGQISAALGLLKKTVPDLQSVAHTGANGTGPVAVQIMSSDGEL